MVRSILTEKRPGCLPNVVNLKDYFENSQKMIDYLKSLNGGEDEE